MKKYKFKVEIWGLILFGFIMIPTIIWSIVPAPNDVLRGETNSSWLDVISSIFQVLMVGVLGFFINKEAKKFRLSPLIIIMICCCLIYYGCWITYYCGITHKLIILGMTLPPCLAFVFLAIDRKNYLALIPATIFTICHLAYSLINFII